VTPLLPLIAAMTLGVVPVAAGPALVEEPGRLFVEANNRYDSGDYIAASELFERLVHAGAASGHVYYNLGNSQLRAGRVGKAIAAYLAARGELPRDSDVRANLEYARKLTKDALAPPGTSPVVRTLFFWHYSASSRELAWLLLAFNLAFWTALAFMTRRRDSELLRWSVVALLLLVLAVGASVAVRAVAPNRLAVVLEREVDVHSGTHRDTVVRFKLHEGTEAIVTDHEPGWIRIELADDKQGWVAADEVAVVEW
jgi:hypothetical protein